MLEVTLDGCMLDIYDLPGAAQEGVTMYGLYRYLAQGSGGIIRYKFHRKFRPVLEESQY